MSINDIPNKDTTAKKYKVDEVDHSGFVSWDERYSVGIEAMDRDHKNLLRLINNAQAAVQFQIGEQAEYELLQDLIEYTTSHFSREEALMREYGFPGYEGHKRKHDEMTIIAKNMLKSYKQDRLLALKKIPVFLRDWLFHHINGMDKRYGDYLISEGYGDYLNSKGVR